MINEIKNLPTTYQQDINYAVEILKEAGCSQIFIFGSVAQGKVREGSDIDLAIRGCPKGKYFHVWGKLMKTLTHSVDLVRLDTTDPFARRLEKEGRLIQLV